MLGTSSINVPMSMGKIHIVLHMNKVSSGPLLSAYALKAYSY